MVYKNIDEALQKAMDEVFKKEYVLAVAYQPLPPNQEHRKCGFVAKLLDVKHLMKQGGSNFSHISVYIDEKTFEYDFHYGGPKLEPDTTPFADLLKSKLASVKTALSLDFIEVKSIDEANKSAVLFAVIGTTGNLANTYTIKVWKKTATTIGYKIIEETTVE